MGMISPPSPPEREELESLSGVTLIIFGASWCGFCQTFLRWFVPLLTELEGMTEFRGERCYWIEDGPGKRLGRSFQVRLWPTVVVLFDGQTRAKFVRPKPEELREELWRLASFDRPNSESANG